MKVLVIPDIHLKPWIFDEASKILKKGIAKKAVVLGDLVDDWNQLGNIKLYEETLNKAISFAKKYPDTMWCYGNHELSYLQRMYQSGYSYAAQIECEKGLRDLYITICEISNNNPPIGIVQRIDNVWFSHAGVTESYALRLVWNNKHEDGSSWAEDTNLIFNLANDDNIHSLWENDSPLWYRPEYDKIMYKPDEIMQVVGHTPIKKITFDNNLLCTDVFSTYSTGGQIGESAFAIIDTKKQTYKKYPI